MPRALISVSDKTGVTDFARALTALGWQILSTGGTAATLRGAGVAVTDVADVTRHPEMMEGRVKTLHPAIHAGLLARRDRDDDMRALAGAGYEAIDMVVVNLYPFHEAVAAGADIPKAMEKVDVGGPTMIRAAAKNHAGVWVVVDPADYDEVLGALRGGGGDHAPLRRRLAAKVFAHTGAYDSAIAAYITRDLKEGREASHATGHAPADRTLPADLELRMRRVQPLRYGENPDQPAAFYRDGDAPAGSLPDLEQLQGKELSFNNLLDAEAAVAAVSAWADTDRACCVVIKHTTPCGIALADDGGEAWGRALAGDPVSAFGGIVAFNTPVTGATAQALRDVFLEIVIAPAFDDDARDALASKKNLRLLKLPITPAAAGELDYKRVRGGFLVQTRLRMEFPETEWRVVTKREPTDAEWRDLRFAWRASAMVKSNAIVLARDERTIGIGAGQTSRVDSSRIAAWKAGEHSGGARDAALASDAFFPFRDGIDAAAAAGVRAVIQPGGSVRDEEVIAAADEHGMAMVFTGRRLFRH
jgi:phosphoribosylaminoimidazolecarboxamide formyltransferase / IMP cyclohydrolase